MLNTIKKILSTNILVQAFGLLIYIILLRSISIEDFAIYGMLYGAMSISSILFTLKIDNLFFSLDVLSSKYLYSAYIKFIFFPLLVFCFSLWLMSLFHNYEEFIKITIVLLSGLFLAVFNVTYCFLVRTDNEKYNIIKIIRSILELLLLLVSINFSLEIDQLFLLTSSTYFLVVIYYIFKTSFYPGSSKYIRENWKFIRFDLIASIFNTLYLYSPNYFLYFGGNKEISGYYFMINRFFGVPVLMVAQSLSTTLKQYLSGKDNSDYDDILNYFKNKIFNKIFPIYIVLCILSIFLAVFLDKVKYPGILTLSILLIPLFVSRFRFIVFSGLFYVLKAYTLNLKLQSVLVVSVLLAIYLGYLFNSSLLSVGIYSVLTVLSYEYFLISIKKVKPSLN